MAFIDDDDLVEISGLPASYFTDALIAYGEAKTKLLLGYLEEEEKEYKRIILADAPRKVLDLPFKNGDVTLVEYRTSSAGDWTETTAYRSVDGILIFDTALSGYDYEVRVTYTIGYVEDIIPVIVKLLILLVTLQILDTTQPSVVDFNIVSKKLGDFSVSYQNNSSTNIESVINNLVILIKQGELEPGVSI